MAQSSHGSVSALRRQCDNLVKTLKRYRREVSPGGATFALFCGSPPRGRVFNSEVTPGWRLGYNDVKLFFTCQVKERDLLV
jgi:hypothetical protein